jgi:pre-rRNA-processing protein TSR1
MVQRTGLKNSHIAHGKADRLNSAKQQRDRKRAELLEARRTQGPPCIVAILPLSDDVDVQLLWDGLLAACREDTITSSSKAGTSAPVPSAAVAGNENGMEVDVDDDKNIKKSGKDITITNPLAPITMSLPERRKIKFTFLPPPVDRTDPLAVVEIGRAAEVVLFVLPGEARAVAVDSEGQTAVSVLRSMGLPSSVALVQTASSDGTSSSAGNSMKERSAAKKRATEAFLAELPGDYRVLSADTSTDFKQILRHLADSPHAVPLWRRQRPQLVAQAADFLPDPSNPAIGRLVLTGYIRGHGLSASQAVHIPTAGDFQIEQIDACTEPASANETSASGGGVGATAGQSNGVAAMEAEVPTSSGATIAQVAPEARESLIRENEPDLLDGEQTWPTEEELKDAKAQRAAAMKKSKLPKGTSDYQAAWILDNDEDDEEEDLEEEDDAGSLPDLELNTAAGAHGGGAQNIGSLGDGFEDSWQNMDGGATEIDMDYADEDEEDALDIRAAKIKARRDAQEDELKYPDEIDTPLDIPARKRFARYRGLKSFRTSPWDPKEDLPQDYARVFAFENFKRTLKRAREAAAKIEPGQGVLAGSYVSLHAAAVPAEVALRVVERIRASQSGAACVLSAWGLLQHECKLSVVNFGIKKVSGFTDPVANKEELLFVTGLRSFMARPIFSTDEHGADKHKLERFLLEGRPSMATIFAPISYPPLPLLAFKPRPSGQVVLAATGALRDCNPDRVVLKKIVLTGYPVKAHKSKAVVKWMFHTPEDVRWFRPVELWTKEGRRGRIREPLGTHGTMKCIFDGPIQQQDAVCMSLFKRAYPKWPENMSFA